MLFSTEVSPRLESDGFTVCAQKSWEPLVLGKDARGRWREEKRGSL